MWCTCSNRKIIELLKENYSQQLWRTAAQAHRLRIDKALGNFRKSDNNNKKNKNNKPSGIAEWLQSRISKQEGPGSIPGGGK